MIMSIDYCPLNYHCYCINCSDPQNDIVPHIDEFGSKNQGGSGIIQGIQSKWQLLPAPLAAGVAIDIENIDDDNSDSDIEEEEICHRVRVKRVLDVIGYELCMIIVCRGENVYRVCAKAWCFYQSIPPRARRLLQC